ncbi:hypothetical protein GCM10010377_71030 [Streptomyces viridiviolaceus]|nr:hypothetical protein GCM10010377_71030 [Streptomyces viridiviolaceus]
MERAAARAPCEPDGHIAAVLSRDGRLGEVDAAMLVRVVSAVMFLAMAASVNAAASVDGILCDILGQAAVLPPC